MSIVFKEPSTLPQATSTLQEHTKTEDPKMELPYLLLKGMATCHSLTIIDGTLNGDPLDLKVSIHLKENTGQFKTCFIFQDV
jgi:hypothetical protein